MAQPGSGQPVSEKSERQIEPLRYHSSTWQQFALSIFVLALYLGIVSALVTWFATSWLRVGDYFQATGTVPWSSLILAIIATLLTFTWISPMVHLTSPRRGISLLVSDHPEFFKALTDGLKIAQLPPMVSVEVTPDASLALALPRSFLEALIGTRRRLLIGMATIDELNIDQLASLAAAAHSGWGGVGFGIGGFNHRMAQGIEILSRAYSEAGCLQFINPLFWVTVVAAQLINKAGLIKHTSYQLPLFGDVFGARVGGQHGLLRGS